MLTVEMYADDRRANFAPFPREYYHQPGSLIHTVNKLEMYVNAGLRLGGGRSVIIKKEE